MLPKNFPNDLLHMITGIPSIAVFLRQKLIQRLALLIKTYDNTISVDEKQLIEYNIEEMSRNQKEKLGITDNWPSIHSLDLLQLQAESDFWTELKKRNPNFPRYIYE